MDPNLVVINLDEAAAHVEPISKVKSSPCVEVYDSRCMRHITLYCDDVVNFIKISPKSFQATKQQNFTAVGMGEMIVDVPNGINILQLKFTEVLYLPEVGYTLVSIGCIDKNGFSVIFANGKCMIQGPKGESVGAIQKSGHGLYQVTHESEIANTATEILTLDQFHHIFLLKWHESLLTKLL
jgi:hypothetical protein